MPAYISSGLTPKYLLSPRVTVYSDEFKALEAQADVLEVEFENLRSIPLGYPVNQAHLARIRALRKQLSALDAQSRTVLNRDNPEWAQYWGQSGLN
jgi:hypothetical protein